MQPTELHPYSRRAFDEPTTSVLIVDDDPIFRSVIQRALQFRKLVGHIATAADGLAALDLLSAHSYDWLITDDRMPGMSGRELISTIEQTLAHRPDVILCTANPDWLEEASDWQEPITVLEKPFPLSILIDVVSRRNTPSGVLHG